MPDYKPISNHLQLERGFSVGRANVLRLPTELYSRDSSGGRGATTPTNDQCKGYIDKRQYIGSAVDTIDSRAKIDDSARRLGSNAKFASPSPNQPNRVTDEMARLFRLQNEARRLAAPKRRVRRCLRTMAHTAENVGIHRSGAKASFSGLQTCGSVWDCPICSRKITERRALELDTAVGRWIDNGGAVYLVTFTLSHNPSMNLSQALKQLQTAYRRFKSGKGWQQLAPIGEQIHSVRSIEVTIGDNGWHPHIHELVFADPVSNAALEVFKAKSAARWVQCVTAAGGSALSGVAYKLSSGDTKISEYVSKYGHAPKDAGWSVGRELSKSVSKRASRSGLTPQQLLMQSAEGNKYAGALWREYSDAMHGKQQLVWSVGLRAAVGMEEYESDAAIAAETDESTEFIQITRSGWSQLMTSGEDVRPTLLHLAAAGHVAAFAAFCVSCGVRPDEVIVSSRGHPEGFNDE